MQTEQERRRESRIRFSWPLWFGYEERGEFHRGQVVDLGRSGVAFTVEEGQCPQPGQHVVTRFSFPRNLVDEFEMGSYYHWSEVLRVERQGNGHCRVAMRLHRPLACDPGATAEEELVAQTA
jgi:hypothetical protein